MNTYSGFTSTTADSLQLDAGAFFKNFTVGTDTFASAVTAGKLVGATQGGGEFSAKPDIRQIQIDGVKGRAKGLEVLNSWEVYLKATFVEHTVESLKLALGAAKSTAYSAGSPATGTQGYTEVEARNNIETTDYIDNITWVGTLSGSNKPIIIQVYNALSTDGFTFSPSDGSEGTIEMTFYGHYTQSNLDTPPFKIYYPTSA